MAGYMSKLMNYVFEGEAVAAADIRDGHFCTLGVTSGVLKATEIATADTTSTFVCVELPDANGMARFLVTNLAAQIYMVEGADAKARTYAIDAYAPYGAAGDDCFKAGELVRVHPLQAGEEIMTDNFSGTLTIGKVCKLNGSGVLA